MNLNIIHTVFSIDYWKQMVSTRVVSAYQFCQISRYFQHLLLSIVMVRSGLPLAEIGAFEITLFFMTLLSQFWVSGFKEALVSKISQIDRQETEDWISKASFSYFVVGILTSALFLFLTPAYLRWEHDLQWPQLMIFGALYLSFQAWGNLAEIILLLRKDAGKLSIFGLLTGFVFVILMFVFWFTTHSWELLFAIMLVFTGGKSLYSFWIIRKISWGNWRVDIQSFVSWSFPFFLISLVGYGMEMLDSFLVVHFYDESIFPIYKYGAREFPVSSLLMSSLSVAMIPGLQHYDTIVQLKKRVNRYMHILFPVTIILILVSNYAFEWVYGKDFILSSTIFNIYLLVLGSRLLLPHSIVLARGGQKDMLVSSIIELFINLGLSLWWVTIWGIGGLVAATVVAYYSQKIYLLVILHRKWKLSLSDIIEVKWWVVYQILAVIAVVLSNQVT